MAVDRTPKALDELPEGIRREVGDTTDQAVAKTLIDPTAGMAAYSRSKAALSHLVRILDLELRPHGIRVNAVAPQLLDTSRKPDGLPGGGAGTRRPAGSGRGHHRLPRQRPRRTRQRCGLGREAAHRGELEPPQPRGQIGGQRRRGRAHCSSPPKAYSVSGRTGTAGRVSTSACPAGWGVGAAPPAARIERT